MGHKSPRDAIGAKVKLTTASGRVLHNHVAISVGFMSSSDKRVHFGLGAETKISSIEIRWPSGIQQVLKDVAADQIPEAWTSPREAEPAHPSKTLQLTLVLYFPGPPPASIRSC